ncbi:uncharacterized protein LOC133824482 [Humulus lupulus]|uniref:uncharacterized protein LOC133824482 n=1 Tax=Humulus lupulus TaxID=3486 RepID=UPI002B417B51|nr:uncharacterized protein LOC133824482 [Humulus lupulus]
MDRIFCCNVQGINSQHKHQDIKHLILSKNVGLVSLLETKVKNKNMGSLYNSLFSGWFFTDNNPWIDKGRIIVAWNPKVYSLDIRLCTTQLIHCLVQVPNQAGSCFITFVYGFNDELSTEQLWKDMQELVVSIVDPWMVIGNFNEILSHHERIGKKVAAKLSSSFQDCLSFCYLEDLKFSGCFYTWNNKQKAEEKIYSKIDRALVNSQWTDYFPNSEVVFLLEGLFDHSPVLVHFYLEFAMEKKPFRYFQIWKEAPSYAVKIQTSWNIPVVGTEMFQVVSKLKRLKHTEFKAKILLRELQEKLHKDPLNDCLINQEQVARENFLHFHKAYMMFLAQKAKARRIQNRILSIKNKGGIWVDTPTGMKAPGPDGYSSYFYQDNLNLVGLEVSAVVLSFLKSGKLLKEINATTITLIPKTICPDNVCDFRPIACCNVIYKATSKMIFSRLHQVLLELIAENQGGFVHGRYIAYNIMICQDLVRHYGRKNCKPCCMIKLDLRKAYDTIEWDFIEEMLTAFHFPMKFI